MNQTSLSQLDLNLLRLFIHIYELKNLTHTAEEFHLSQSAVSHALGRLRQALGDKLFYREKGELHPTPYAKRLYPAVKHTFTSLEKIFQTPQTLSDGELSELAKQSFDKITIAMQDEIELIVFDTLVANIHASLPDCQITSSRLNRQELEHELKAGQVDVAIDVARVVSEDIYHQPLIQDDFVLAYYAPNFIPKFKYQGHHNNGFDETAYFDSQHITVSSRRLGHSIEDNFLSKLGRKRQIKIRCQHYATACQLLTQGKLLLTLPKQLAHKFIPDSPDWQVTTLPIALPSIALHLYWHKQHENDALHTWLRKQLMVAFGKF